MPSSVPSNHRTDARSPAIRSATAREHPPRLQPTGDRGDHIAEHERGDQHPDRLEVRADEGHDARQSLLEASEYPAQGEGADDERDRDGTERHAQWRVRKSRSGVELEITERETRVRDHVLVDHAPGGIDHEEGQDALLHRTRPVAARELALAARLSVSGKCGSSARSTRNIAT